MLLQLAITVNVLRRRHLRAGADAPQSFRMIFIAMFRQVLLVIRKWLAAENCSVSRNGNPYVMSAGGKFTQKLEGRFCSLLNLGIQLLPEEFARHSQAEWPGVFFHRCRIVYGGEFVRTDVRGIVAGNGLQDQRGIGHGSCHRTSMVVRPGERNYTASTHQSVTRLQADNAAA